MSDCQHLIECTDAGECGQLVAHAQDRRDGAALRRLREGLPGKCWTVLRHYNYENSHGVPYVVDVEDFDFRVRGKGATIAEAADKCREALYGLG